MLSEEFVIDVRNLSKRYEIYAAPRDRLKQMVLPRIYRASALVGQMFGHKSDTASRQYFREFWALRDVSFQVRRGETLGIVGRNGSGKSTLLQLICGTLTPTHGEVSVKGRISALLELGSGFNPEYTGRENIFLNGQILGLSQSEIEDRYDSIIEFADIGEFVDQPVKTYSSGMTVRLAFAVAINVDPQILVIDEALSVGDELFQRKCFSRIEAIKKRGATILFVSHSGASVIQLCDRAVLIDSGEKLTVGTPKKIVGRYQKLLYAPEDKREVIREQIRHEVEGLDLSGPTPTNSPYEDHATFIQAKEPQDSFDPHLKPKSTIEYESHGAIIETPIITNLEGKQVNVLRKNRTYRYVYSVKFSQPAACVRFGMVIKNPAGIEVGGAATSSVANSIQLIPAGSSLQIEFTFKCSVNNGLYFLNAGVLGNVGNGEIYLHRLLDACAFRVSDEQDCSSGIVDFGCVSKIRGLFNEDTRDE